MGAGRSASPADAGWPGGIRSSRSSAGCGAADLAAPFGVGSSASASADRGAGLLDVSAPASGLARFGAGRSASSSASRFGAGAGTPLAGVGIRTPADGVGTFMPLAGAGILAGIAGIFVGSLGIAGTALPGTATFDLQLVQATNLAPGGTWASAMRFTVPHAAQVASIIQQR